MGRAASIARRLGATCHGNQWRVTCPSCGGYELALGKGEVQDVIAFCPGCGWDAISANLLPFGLFDVDDDDGAEVMAPTPRPRVPDAERIANALRIYNETQALAASYLRDARGITLPMPAVLREHPSCPHRRGFRARAMVAPFVDVDGNQTASHITFLRPDGRDKAELPKEFQRECRGVVRGRAIRLMSHDPGCELVIGEGIESALSAAQLMSLPAWAAGNADNLGCLELPEGINRIVIAADRDNAGLRAAERARERWAAEGRRVRIFAPRRAGTDFNDLLREAGNGLHAGK